MSELLPCPFCGKNAKSIYEKSMGHRVMCMWCHASTPNYRPEAKMAKADWNRRADHVNELVAAAYEEAASTVRRESPVDAHPDSYIAWLHQYLAKTVLILTPADATAALAARDTRVRIAALREAAEVCKTAAENDEADNPKDIANAILALIAKDTTNG